MAAVRLALTQFGVQERPRGSNVNPYSSYFGYGAQYWCADFVSWCVDRVGNRDKKLDWGYPSGVKSINDWASRTRNLRSGPAAGDVFTYANNEHTGFIVAVAAPFFLTIEGNTGGPDDTSHQSWVASHTRDSRSG